MGITERLEDYPERTPVKSTTERFMEMSRPSPNASSLPPSPPPSPPLQPPIKTSGRDGGGDGGGETGGGETKGGETKRITFSDSILGVDSRGSSSRIWMGSRPPGLI